VSIDKSRIYLYFINKSQLRTVKIQSNINQIIT